jgi:hypothetical protein
LDEIFLKPDILTQQNGFSPTFSHKNVMLGKKAQESLINMI